jgi:hypothetical protein
MQISTGLNMKNWIRMMLFKPGRNLIPRQAGLLKSKGWSIKTSYIFE